MFKNKVLTSSAMEERLSPPFDDEGVETLLEDLDAIVEELERFVGNSDITEEDVDEVAEDEDKFVEGLDGIG